MLRSKFIFLLSMQYQSISSLCHLKRAQKMLCLQILRSLLHSLLYSVRDMGKGPKAFNQGAGMAGSFQADFISSFNTNCTAVYDQYGIDEMLRYLLYIAQQIAPIKRINIVCTTDSGEVVIPVGDSSRENFYRIVTSQTHRYPLISRENISQKVIINDIDSIKREVYPKDNNLINPTSSICPFTPTAPFCAFPSL